MNLRETCRSKVERVTYRLVRAVQVRVEQLHAQIERLVVELERLLDLQQSRFNQCT